MSQGTPSEEKLVPAIKACIENGQRLIDESYDLEFRDPTASQYFLIMIAQEELAKAFMLYLVKDGIIPFSTSVRRAIKDHTCKQLAGMIMDYIIMHWESEDELRAEIDKDFAAGDRMPSDVGSAMELLRYEKIGRWEANNWVWAEDPQYDKSALRVAKGAKDRRKQDALYVGIGRDGRVSSTPMTITKNETQAELDRARRYKYFLVSVLDGKTESRRHEKALSALKLLFAPRQK